MHEDTSSERRGIHERVLALAQRVGLVDDTNLHRIDDLIKRVMLVEPDLDEHALVGLIQAYGRGIDRVAAAEAGVIAGRLAGVAPDEVERTLRAWLDAVLPLSTEAFSTIHERRLEQHVRRRADAATAHGELDDDEVTDLAVALVDLRGSTAFMLRSEPADICRLVDDLYLVVAEVAERHAVHAGKFLGDGADLPRAGQRTPRGGRP